MPWERSSCSVLVREGAYRCCRDGYCIQRRDWGSVSGCRYVQILSVSDCKVSSLDFTEMVQTVEGYIRVYQGRKSM